MENRRDKPREADSNIILICFVFNVITSFSLFRLYHLEVYFKKKILKKKTARHNNERFQHPLRFRHEEQEPPHLSVWLDLVRYSQDNQRELGEIFVLYRKIILCQPLFLFESHSSNLRIFPSLYNHSSATPRSHVSHANGTPPSSTTHQPLS